ncbi:MAG: bis(5'-nucleosyl)-tetraphosphatase [Gammaproteobacteria bacterium]|nr:MAG: bis(5'-nucleosyl)-tetraphosphatase [Gammaproteobacteria bacterium]
MADYFVGDVQGCLSELKALLKQVNFSSATDTLYLAGDIVARGEDSLATLRFVKSLKNSAKMVLGNHDLHLLSIHAGIKKPKPADKLAAILSAHDCTELLTWLAQQPLLIKLPNEEAYLSHAGISPQWSIADAITQARFAEKKLRGSKRDYWLKQMYGELPNNWHNVQSEIEKFRYTINAFTRMRFCFTDLSLEFDHKFSPDNVEPHLKPWYELSPVVKKHHWVFGHWASLMGNTSNKKVFALDTGCVWGNHLTLLRWHDKTLFIEPAHTPS